MDEKKKNRKKSKIEFVDEMLQTTLKCGTLNDRTERRGREKVRKIDGDKAEREKKWRNIEKGREKRGIEKQTGKETVMEEERNG